MELPLDPMITTNLDGIIQSVNPAAEQLFGYEAKDLIGQPIALLTPADRRDELASVEDRVHRGERIDDFETVRQHRSGRSIDVLMTIVPAVDDRGVTVGATRAFEDITERVRTAAAQSH